ncbi:MAG: SDR family oxidoreductase [Gloeobacterales cyanobacterium]
MFSIKNLVVLVTGASSGIGLACARIFAQAGAKVILSARRLERLETLTKELEKEFKTDIYILPMDVTHRSQVESQLDSLPEDWSKIDILINNAGLSRGLDKLYEGNIQDWEEMIDTNMKGLLYVTRSVVPGMVKRGRGHVINIGSLAGHQTYPRGNVYCGTKVAVRAISEGLKQDLLGTPLRVTSVDPGLVETEFSKVRFRGDEDRAHGVYQGLTPLTPEDVADTVFYCATRPPHVNINEVLMMPTDQSGSTLVHRQS